MVGSTAAVVDRVVATVLGGATISEVRPLPGGFRNHNLFLRTSDGWRFVLRRYADPSRCPVEAALMERLAGRVAVPEVVAADPGGQLCGEPFLLTRYFDGIPLTQALAVADRRGHLQLAKCVAQSLAAIHRVRFDRPGVFLDESLDPAPVPAEFLSLPIYVESVLRSGGDGVARLSTADRESLVALAVRWQPLVENVGDARMLVHSDWNPKNLIVTRTPGGSSWKLAVVVDWEFAFSGSGLVDLGNLLRFAPGLPSAFCDAVPAMYRSAGGQLGDGWRETSSALDLFALTELLTRPAGNLIADKALSVIRALLP